MQFYGLSQLAFYYAYSAGAALAGGDDVRRLAGGVAALRLEFTLLVLLRFAMLLAAYRRRCDSTPLATALMATAFVLSLTSVGVMRPQLFGEFFFACLLFALSRPVLSWRAALTLPLLFVLWVNCHGSYLIGQVFLTVCLIGRGIEAARGGGGFGFWRDAQVRRLAAVLLACSAASCVNPQGAWIYMDTLHMAHNPAVAAIAEWQPLGVHPSPVLVASPFLLALLLAGVTQWLSHRTFAPTQILLLLVFGAAACCQQRVVIWLVMVTPWVLAPCWAAILEKRAAARQPSASVPSFRKTLIALGLGFVAGMWSPTMSWVIGGAPPSLANSISPGTPWELARQLRAPDDPQAQWLPELTGTLRSNYPEGRFTGAVFASETLGDYLTWALAPAVPVTSYSHLHLFPATYWEDSAVIYAAKPGWWDLLRRRHANLVVVEAETYPLLCQRLREDAGWVVLRDEAGDAHKISPHCRMFIAVRKKPA